MAKLIYLDAGHGGKDPGACANGLREADLTIKVINYTASYLRNNYVCDVYVDTSGDDLNTICARANRLGADLFMSDHFNAGKGDGWEGLVYSKSREDLGRIFEKHMKAIGQNSRGVKYRPDLAVLRLTNMAAILNETAFIDNKKDIKDFDEDYELKKVGKAHADACAEYLHLSKKASGSTYKALSSMNIRNKPSLAKDVKIVGTLKKGQTITGTPYEKDKTWLKTSKGYIRIKGEKTYLKKV